MFLIKSFQGFPENLSLHCFSAVPIPGKYGWEKPDDLVKLAQSLWPEEIINKLVKLYKDAGVPDPINQKLVEPLALVFGGRKNESVADLSKVNWEEAYDYFEWELASMNKQNDKAKEIDQKAMKKYGHGFNHYVVYDPNPFE